LAAGNTRRPLLRPLAARHPCGAARTVYAGRRDRPRVEVYRGRAHERPDR
jgi:hypothetical protein